jgi:hypothetical protein
LQRVLQRVGRYWRTCRPHPRLRRWRLPCGRTQALLAAVELGIGLRELEAERGGLGVDAVAAADGERILVLVGALLEGGEQQVEVFQQQVGGAHQLHVQAGVEHV